MKLFSEKNQCCGCMACADICPQNAIHMNVDSEGFLYPEVSEELCTSCNCCKKVCPMTDIAPHARPLKYFAAQAKDQTLREAGASGGVSPVLAEYVLERGGVVYGAAFDDSMHVAHQRADNRDGLGRLARSKYIQSETAGIFRCVQKDLQMGLETLFVGTPCQTEALRRFLPRKYPNLLLVDLICYGVPSPGVWAKYVSYLEKKRRGHMTGFRFRENEMHDNGQAVWYQIDGREYVETYSDNVFMPMFFSNCMLRPSCHNCPFTTVERSSDITIGDFWNVENRLPQINDGMGTSLVILHSEKGAQIWDEVQNRFLCMECREDKVMQPRLVSPSPVSTQRQLFFSLYHRLPFSVVAGLFHNKISRRFWRERNGT